MDFIIGFGLGAVVGVFHAQLLAFAKPLLASGWARFQQWRASRGS